MPTQHRGPHALHGMEMEYHYHPFGDEKFAAQRVVQPFPTAFDVEKRLDWDANGNVEYLGFAEIDYTSLNDTIDPDAGTDTWMISKFTYDANANVIRIQQAKGAWDDRTTIFP